MANALVNIEEVDRIVREDLTNRFCKGYSTYGEDNTLLPVYYNNFKQSIEDFEIYDNDVFVISFPKSGTTWTQEMVWLICNNLDYEAAKINLNTRFPFLELSALLDPEAMEKDGIMTERFRNSIGLTKQQKRPRFIKTHLPYSLLPNQIRNGSKKPKIIYVIRNPKDVCTSYYYHTKLLPLGTSASLEDYTKVFLAGKAIYSPYWPHIFRYLEHGNDPNILVLSYEDMKKDLPSIIRKVASFFEKELTEEQIQKLSKHLSFESMKNNNAVNYSESIESKRKGGVLKHDGAFMRSGTVGQYKDELSEETIRKIDQWTKENVKGTHFEQLYNFNV